MPRPLADELRTFFVNMYHLKFKSLLVIIVALISLPFFFYKKIKEGLTKDFNTSFRYLMVYLINMYHLILLYNHKIYELDNGHLAMNGGAGIGAGNGVGANAGFDGDLQHRPIDILRRFIDQAGINLDGLVDIEIIQLEPENNRRGHVVENNPGDTQNVHDTSVQSHISLAINALKKCKKNVKITDGELINDIRHHILNESKCLDEAKDKALVALKKIKKYNGLLTRLNISEIEILHLIWNRINAPCNKDVMHTIKDNLTIELADSIIDDDNVHCVQGRITRILQSLQNADTEGILNIKPLWVIKEEISSVFGKYRTILWNKLTPETRIIYDKGNPDEDEQVLIEKINLKLRSQINDYLTKKYVDTEIINLQQYHAITKDYFAALS
jgi:hypothetical protein